MDRFKPALLVALTAAVVLAAAPASATTWSCTAKNARGQAFTSTAVGVISGAVHDRAKTKALTKCAASSVVCAIAHCEKSTP